MTFCCERILFVENSAPSAAATHATIERHATGTTVLPVIVVYAFLLVKFCIRYSIARSNYVVVYGSLGVLTLGIGGALLYLFGALVV